MGPAAQTSRRVIGVDEPGEGAGAGGGVALAEEDEVVDQPVVGRIRVGGAGFGVGVPELYQEEVEVGVEGGAEDGGGPEEAGGGDVDADEGEAGLAGGDEEVGVLDAEKGDADEDEVAEQGEPGGAGEPGELVDAGDLGFGGGHGTGPGMPELPVSVAKVGRGVIRGGWWAGGRARGRLGGGGLAVEAEGLVASWRRMSKPAGVPSEPMRNWAKPTGRGPRLAATAAKRPCGTRVTLKASPFQGASARRAPVPAMARARPSPSAVSAALPSGDCVGAGEGFEIGRRGRVDGAGEGGGGGLGGGLGARQHLRGMVDLGVAEQPVERPYADGVGQADVRSGW